jgi:hypothetical protein
MMDLLTAEIAIAKHMFRWIGIAPDFRNGVCPRPFGVFRRAATGGDKPLPYGSNERRAGNGTVFWQSL